MNKDINRTLMALVPILRMNGEMVKSIEAVNDWFKVGDREYLKEVAEITYDNGTRRYADIGCDSNLTAVFDVVAVIQQIKPRSSAIERIVRGVYRQYPIESIPAADDWIPVTERVPDGTEGDWVLGVVYGDLYDGGYRMDAALELVEYDEDSGCWYLHYVDAKVTVTHWMPLPKPPEEVDNE